MPNESARGRSALLAGATGLIGRALLPLLLDSPAYRHVTVLARSPLRAIDAHPKLEWVQVDFGRLPEPLCAVDDVYIALGTTIKAAGSEQAFRRVDFDHVVDTARAARASGATRLAVVSALGAASTSRVFYNRVKGDMQSAVKGLGYAAVAIAQPSLLMGDRAALGQPVRNAEVIAARLLRPVMVLVPKSVRPIAAGAVAAALMQATLAGTPGVHVLGSARMQGPGRS